MKIYFAGSIRGGRSDAAFYLKLVKHLQQYGQVLTEHVGDLDLTEQGEDGPTDDWIFQRDIEWLTQSDVVVAEVTTPSLGVGYEIGIADKAGIQTLCLYRNQPGKKLSAMIGGNSNLKVVKYNADNEAFIAIDDYFRD